MVRVWTLPIGIALQRDAEGRLVDSANSEAGTVMAPPRREALRDRILAEILPRLERPGRCLGPFVRASDLDSTAAPVVVWTTRSAGEVESLARRLRPDLPQPLAWLASPSPVLHSELRARSLPLFTRPSLCAVSEHSVCVLLLEHPLEAFDLLRLLAALPEERPALVAMGRAVATLRPLLEESCDLVVDTPDMGWVLAAAQQPAALEAITAAAEAAGVECRRGRGRASTPWPGDLELPPEGRPRAEDRLVTSDDLAECGVLVSELGEGGRKAEVRLWAAGADRRRALDIPWTPEDDRALGDALADEFVPIRIHLALGLPPLDGGDVGAGIALLRELRAVLGSDRRLELQLHAFAGTELEPEPAGLESWADAFEEGLRDQKVRVGRPRPVLGLLEALRRRDDSALNTVLRLVFARGAGSAQSKLATDLDLWHKSMQEAELSPLAGEPWPRPVVDAAPAHGLELAPRPLAVAASENGADPDQRRWQKWQTLVPRRFDYRIVLRTAGAMRFLSQGELGALIAGLCREGGLPLATTGMVQPKLKMSFGPWLAVGIEGAREYLDLSFLEKVADLQSRLDAVVPEGLSILDVQEIPPGQPQLALSRVALAEYEVRLSPPFTGETRDRHAPAHVLATLAERVRALREALEQRGESSVEDLHHQLHDVHWSTDADAAACLAFTLDLRDPGAKRKPHDFLGRLFGDLVEDVRTLPIRRTALYLRDESGGAPCWRTPDEMLARFRQRIRKAEKTCA